MNPRPASNAFPDVAQNAAADNAPAGMTPAGLQPVTELRKRRLLVLALNLVTYAAMLFGLSVVLGAGGWTIADRVIFVAFMFGAPWTVLGFWNAVLDRKSVV